jgi:hypothetical protein
MVFPAANLAPSGKKAAGSSRDARPSPIQGVIQDPRFRPSDPCRRVRHATPLLLPPLRSVATGTTTFAPPDPRRSDTVAELGTPADVSQPSARRDSPRVPAVTAPQLAQHAGVPFDFSAQARCTGSADLKSALMRLSHQQVIACPQTAIGQAFEPDGSRSRLSGWKA